jgi:PAS domain S-box-containing protein
LLVLLPRDDSRWRRRVAAAVAIIVALALAAGVGRHVVGLRTAALSAASQQTSRASARAVDMVDLWAAAHRVNASAATTAALLIADPQIASAGLPAPVLVVPHGGSLVALTRCSGGTSVCPLPSGDTLPIIASHHPDGVSEVIVRGGRHLLFAVRRAHGVPWIVYVAVDEQAVMAPVHLRLQFEGLVFLGLMVVFGLAVYAYDRALNVRRLTERAQSEARFAAIVNTAMDAIIIVDERYDIIVVNSAAEFMFDYQSGGANGRSVLSLIPEQSQQDLRGALEQTLRDGDQPRLLSADHFVAGRRRDGSSFPIDLSISRTIIDGRPHLTMVIRDVTDWKRAEQSSEWQRRVLEAIATGVELRDVLTTIARFHETQCPSTECAFHLLDDDGLTLRAMSAPSMQAEFVDAMDEIVVGPHAASCGTAVYRREQVITPSIARDRLWNEYRALALEQGYLACWATPIRSPQGRIVGALAVYIRESRPPTVAELRVTAMATQLAGIAVDRAHAAESLRQSEASFRSFVENSPIGIYRATGTGRLLAVNPTLVRLLGYDSALDLLQVDMGARLFVSATARDDLLRQLEAEGELRSTETDWRRKDGSIVTVRVSARAYRDERGSVWFSEGFVENVTPLRAAEQALRQSEKLAALGQLVSGVAHELNNPIAAILHFAEDLLDDERTPADREALSVIRDQARRSRSIVRDLLSFVRFREAARERVQLTEALAASVKALEPLVEEIGAELVAELSAGEVQANTDRAGLQQIVTNLVINAAQAAGPGGTVYLRAAVSAHELEIIVDDTGPGIPPSVIDRIFEPFFTTKPLGEGTGLGLSVTLGIVQQLGGRITVENRPAAEGTGARFRIALPIDGGAVADARHTPRASLAAPPRALTASGAKPRVLIIDDESSIRAALCRFFARRGWEVHEAADGTEGLKAILSGHVDFTAVISDLKMPGCSGVELHDRIAEVAPELLERVVFSTGDVASAEAAEFVRRTRCTVLQKPFELRALDMILKRMREMETA